MWPQNVFQTRGLCVLGLTQHTVVKRQRLLADVSAAMVGYAVSTFVLRQRLVRVDVQRREEQH